MLGERLGELFILVLIIINILQFFSVSLGDLDYLERVISWASLGYIIYMLNPTKIFFGRKGKGVDFLLVVSCFFLMAKDIIYYANSSIKESSALFSFYMLIIENASKIENTSFYIGGGMIIFLAIYLAISYKVEEPSIMSIIHEEGEPPRTFGKFLVRFFIILLLLISFFILIFNLMMEWLGWALEDPIIVIAILFYLFKAKHFGGKTIIYKLGSVGEDFYKRFIALFQSKQTILLGLSGILVLHMLTDIASFIVPYLISTGDKVYFLGRSHATLWTLLSSDLSVTANMVDKGAVALLYLMNSLAIILLLLFPYFIWSSLFKNRDIHIGRTLLTLFFCSVFISIIGPVFSLKSIRSEEYAGVDITTGRLLEHLKINLYFIILAAFIIGLLIYKLYRSEALKDLLIIAGAVYSLVFLAQYIYMFSSSLISYYVLKLIYLVTNSQFFIAFFFFMFLSITIIFYFGTFLYFVYETWK